MIRQFDGTTVEVLDTDAEGRLVLADAVAYAVETLSPAVIVDVATLTGAATLGLGRRHAALYSTSDELAGALVAAADAAGPGRADADEHEVVKGGTAFGTRALLYRLETAAAPK